MGLGCGPKKRWIGHLIWLSSGSGRTPCRIQHPNDSREQHVRGELEVGSNSNRNPCEIYHQLIWAWVCYLPLLMLYSFKLPWDIYLEWKTEKKKGFSFSLRIISFFQQLFQSNSRELTLTSKCYLHYLILKSWMLIGFVTESTAIQKALLSLKCLIRLCYLKIESANTINCRAYL